MRTPEITRTADGLDRSAVRRLLDEAAAADGRSPLSDHLRLELEHGGRPGFAGLTVADDEGLVAYAQIASANDVHTVELVVAPAARDDAEIARDLLAAAVDVVAGDGGGRVQWWAFDAAPGDDDLAASVGLSMTRELHQMRRDLPTDLPVDVATRPFEPGRDEAAFLAVNNRAFAAHPEQGGWTTETLAQRQQEPWFDPAGFLLHERDGRLAAFCWTKLHHDEHPVLGEIYVIAVDPDFQGLGLGRQLTLAGLASIADRDVRIGILYVDGDNTGAVAMYEKLGFAIYRTDRAYTAEVAAR
ncbi:MAG: mycothiol synthase [Ilumatobacteraceae bacterium]